MKTGIEQVATASQSLGAALYETEQAQASSEAPAEDDVVDAEIVDESPQS